MIDWKKGFFRLWLICFPVWVIVVAHETSGLNSLEYAWNYHFNRQFLIDQGPAICRSQSDASLYLSRNPATGAMNPFARPLGERHQIEQPSTVVENEYDRFLQVEKQQKEEAARKDRELARLAEDQYTKCVANYSPDKPNWSWLIPALLPPTIGLAALIFFGFVALAIARWVWRGFKNPAVH